MDESNHGSPTLALGWGQAPTETGPSGEGHRMLSSSCSVEQACLCCAWRKVGWDGDGMGQGGQCPCGQPRDRFPHCLAKAVIRSRGT